MTIRLTDDIRPRTFGSVAYLFPPDVKALQELLSTIDSLTESEVGSLSRGSPIRVSDAKGVLLLDTGCFYSTGF